MQRRRPQTDFVFRFTDLLGRDLGASAPASPVQPALLEPAPAIRSDSPADLERRIAGMKRQRDALARRGLATRDVDDLIEAMVRKATGWLSC